MFIELQPCFSLSAAVINVMLCYLWLTGRTAYSIQMEPEVWSRTESQSPRSHLTPSFPLVGPCLEGRWQKSQQMMSVIMDRKVLWAVNFKHDYHCTYLSYFLCLAPFLGKGGGFIHVKEVHKGHPVLLHCCVLWPLLQTLYFPQWIHGHKLLYKWKLSIFSWELCFCWLFVIVVRERLQSNLHCAWL